VISAWKAAESARDARRGAREVMGGDFIVLHPAGVCIAFPSLPFIVLHPAGVCIALKEFGLFE